MIVPDRDETNRLINNAKDMAVTFRIIFDKESHRASLLDQIAGRLEVQRDCIDELVDDLGKRGAELVKLCEGLVELRDSEGSYSDLFTGISDLLKDANWTENDTTKTDSTENP